MKQKYLNSLLVIMLLIFAGCSEGNSDHQGTKSDIGSGSMAETPSQQSQRLGPEEILLKYLNAELKAGMDGKSKETYRLLSSKDKEVTSEAEYLSISSSSQPDISQNLFSVMTKNVSYKIKNSVIENSVAKIEVELSVPNLSSFLQSAIFEKNTPELEEKIIAYLQSPDVQFDKNLETFELVKEPEGWRIFLDFATTKRIKLLVEEAEELAPSLDMLSPIDGSVLESMKSRLLSAEEKYKEALSLGDSFSAKNNLEYLEKQIKKLRFYEQHKNQVQIRNVHVGEGLFGDKGVFGEVKNNSDVALTKVGITIYFLDKGGNPVHEKSYHPVYITERSYGDDAIPLKPNYSRKFGVKADDAPYDWSEKVNIVLSDIEAD